MAIKEYLYYIVFYIEEALLYEGYCINEKDLSESDIKGDDEDDRFEAFYEMLDKRFSNEIGEFNSVYGTTSLEITEKLECLFSFNKYLPDSLYKSLHWFNKAMLLLNDDDASIDNVKKSIREIEQIDCFRFDDYFKGCENQLKETKIISVKEHYFYDLKKRVKYCEIILHEILKIISIECISIFDKIYSNNKDDSWDTRKIQIFTKNANPSSLYEFKENILYFAERLVLEIGFILEEIVNLGLKYQMTPYMPTPCGMYIGVSFRDTLLRAKRRIIIERKKIEIENEEIPLTLSELKKEKNIAFSSDEKEKIFKELCPLLKNQKAGENLLKEIDEYYLISNTPDFRKRKLGIICYITYCTNLFDENFSFEKFKEKFCNYYGKANISIKPNKIRAEAIHEYEIHKITLYKGVTINLNKLYKRI